MYKLEGDMGYLGGIDGFNKAYRNMISREDGTFVDTYPVIGCDDNFRIFHHRQEKRSKAADNPASEVFWITHNFQPIGTLETTYRTRKVKHAVLGQRTTSKVSANEVDLVWFTPEWRGKGLAKALYKSIVRYDAIPALISGGTQYEPGAGIWESLVRKHYTSRGNFKVVSCTLFGGTMTILPIKKSGKKFFSDPDKEDDLWSGDASTRLVLTYE